MYRILNMYTMALFILKRFYKFFQISRQIKSYGSYMKY
jgi:hypothetical protein